MLVTFFTSKKHISILPPASKTVTLRLNHGLASLGLILESLIKKSPMLHATLSSTSMSERKILGNFPYKSKILSAHNNHPIHFDLTLFEPNSDFPFGQLNGTKNYSRTVFKIQICILPRCSRT